MLYTLQNEFLTVTIDALGAELRSVKATDGTEYLWQGDERYWKGTAPWLFPICGRLPDGKYTYRGKEYALDCHGFARKMEFAAVNVTDTALSLRIEANEQTRAAYPFDFSLTLTYRLTGNRLTCAFEIANRSDTVMPASLGGHPGFCTPIAGEGEFSDWDIVFSAPQNPRAVVISEKLLDSGERVPYTLAHGDTIHLTREMFAHDGTFLSGVSGSATLCSKKSDRSVTVTYGEIAYVGIWSAATGGEYVCIEPWHGMASLEGVTALEEKGDMMQIAPGECRTVQMEIAFR